MAKSRERVDEERLIERYIEPDPLGVRISDAQLRDSGVSVWAMIGYLRLVDGDVERTARDYDVPVEAVDAALAYYRLHRAAIEGRLADRLV